MATPYQDKKPDAFIEAIRMQFRNREILDSTQCLGWGQFLDNSNQHAQVGLYGTAAALVAFKAGGRPDDARAAHTRDSLLRCWQNRAGSPDIQNNLNQSIRLAFFLLSIAKKQNFRDPDVQEILQELLKRQVSSTKLWSDVADDTPASSVPSEYSSAMVLILLKLLCIFSEGNDETDFQNLSDRCTDAATNLEKMYLDDRKRAREYKLPLLIAITLHLEEQTNKQVRSDLRKYLYEKSDLEKRYVHFFDQKRLNDTYIRDYFILPLNIVMPLLRFRRKVSSADYMLSMRTLERLEKSLNDNNGIYQDGVARPSSLEQGFVAIALEAANLPKPNGLKLLLPRLWYRLHQDIPQEYERVCTTLVVFGLLVPAGMIPFGVEIADSLTGILPQTLESLLRSTEFYPKWVIAIVAVVAGAIGGKPEELLRIMFRRKK